MPDTPAETPKTLRFSAAGDWSCSYLAWLPREAPCDREALAASMERGLTRIAPGVLRRLGLDHLRKGRLSVAEVPERRVAELAALMRLLNPGEPVPLEGRGRLLEVIAPGQLSGHVSPLWLALAAACGIADSGGGCVIDPARLLELAPAMLTARIPARPMIVLAEHFTVMSSHEHGTGRITTIGLSRLGMPELAVPSVPDDTLRGFASIVNALAWHLHQQVLSTPIVAGRRKVALPAETVVQPAWREASFARCTVHVPTLEGPSAPPPVRLELERQDGAAPWLVAGPPLAWTRGRDEWARALIRRSGLDLAPPRPPACGHPPVVRRPRA